MQAAFKIENIIPSSIFGKGIPFPGVPKGDGKTWPNIQGLNQWSALGTKFYLPIAFNMLENGKKKITQLPWEPTMSINVQKTIVETVLAGNTRRGTVKELINTQDYVINISGLCLDETRNGYPTGQVELLKTIFEYEGSMEIVSYLTDLFEIKNVVVKGFSLPTIKGTPYAQPFTIDLVSDEDFILTMV
jgi:hypothetical protein